MMIFSVLPAVIKTMNMIQAKSLAWSPATQGIINRTASSPQ
jgi:hypothetical protein